jgi:hypothetical protein
MDGAPLCCEVLSWKTEDSINSVLSHGERRPEGRRRRCCAAASRRTAAEQVYRLSVVGCIVQAVTWGCRVCRGLH